MVFNIVNFYKNLNQAGCSRAKMSKAKASAGGMHPVLTFLGFDSKKLERP
jgi:hypothetical protein